MFFEQYVVSVGKGNTVYNWLEENGYKNCGSLTAENYYFPVIVVEKNKKIFFGTNVTCMAAMLPKVYKLGEIKDKLLGE